MPEPFPSDFVWGAATSAYQIEGAVREGGRGESIWDRFAQVPGAIEDGSSGDPACDHYHRFGQDVQLMADLGLGAYSFSVAWPRVLPRGRGAVNNAGLDYYSRLVDALLAAGITPHLKLYHWDLPQALQGWGGWDNRDTAKAFADYTEAVARRLGDRVSHWTTHVEPWCVAFLGHYFGIHAPGIRDLDTALQATHHLLLSHGWGVQVLRDWLPVEVQVGIGLNFEPTYPARDREADLAAARRYDGFFQRWFLDPLAGRGYPEEMWDLYGPAVPEMEPEDLDVVAQRIDFLGVNYYNSATVADDPGAEPLRVRRVPNPDRERTADREISPEGLNDILMRLYQEYEFPAFYITENGAAFEERPSGDGAVHDEGRCRFLQAHIAQAARALEQGVPLRGYFCWSLLDNFEWSKGYTIRYGITYVDYATQTRTLKDSALWYRDFIQGVAPL